MVLSWVIYIALHFSFCIPAIIYRHVNFKAINAKKAQNYGIVCFFIILLISLLISPVFKIDKAGKIELSIALCVIMSVVSYRILYHGYEADPISISADLYTTANELYKQFDEILKRSDRCIFTNAIIKEHGHIISKMNDITRRTNEMCGNILENHLFLSSLLLKYSCKYEELFRDAMSNNKELHSQELKNSFYNDFGCIKQKYETLCDELLLSICADNYHIHRDYAKLSEIQKKKLIGYLHVLLSEKE